ncbi:hypothetical protein BGP77_12920 [Saccharospirillum sp. MSK14-1]|uniref:putative bifunctional diguanylate cyclase/phosphodiesterase n=1 Tax=Saccharospirillum sp. MSK14-1 TaxID=1897632 RepID=UPI000D37ACF6|nr:bifunctional diguanylate cyclase/phosphodiesterase [Saccharospirillum sp. MSK14-1]PTY37406.1 hypothetical protein BGP77_12920 [Saccharospirillum sp. MSK14-1]
MFKPALRIALIYALFAGAWILFSDRLVESLIDDVVWLNRAQSLKGISFVLITSLLLYILLYQTLRQVQTLTLKDPLTGLPNRYAFEAELKRRCRRSLQRGSVFSLSMLDIDHFKNMNDELGHSIGDDLLVALHGSLRQHLGDSWYLARLGGDEFGLISPPEMTLEECSERLDWLQHSLTRSAKHSRLHGQTVSIGSSHFPGDGDNNRDLMRHADMALFHAKSHGRDRHSVFREELKDRLMERLTLTKDLRQAIDDNAFELVYQPQWNVDEKRWVGAEVLIRWQHPQRGYISPADFIPLAEEQGMIGAITDFVINRAFTELDAAGIRQNQLGRISVNLSHLALIEHATMSHLLRLTKTQPADSPVLRLEITETATMQDLDVALKAISAWRQEGIEFSIDDFGTGYSSLSMLKQLPLVELKIDRSFIQDIPDDHNDAVITETILAMARTLKLEVVAEGVETDAQAAFLTQHGCSIMQGFYYARPMPVTELTQLLNQ